MADTIKTIGVLTSGGDSPGMNAVVRAVVRRGLSKGLIVKGIRRGYLGLLNEEIIDMEPRSVSNIMQHGGTILETERCPEFELSEVQDKAIEVCRKHGIDALVIAGGDGSFRGAQKLAHKGMPIIGIPCTIDGDISCTDYTIGFDTAVNTVLDAITKIRDTSSAHNRTTIIEVMGRDCGDIALFSGLAGGAEYVVVPEKPFNINEIAVKILDGVNKGKLHSIIIKAEGSPMSADEMAKYLGEHTGKDTRVVVLSYLQRGGSPTLMDRNLATLCGAKAVELLAEDSESKAVGIVDNQIVAFDLEDALKQTREFNEEMYRLIDVLSK